MNNKPFFFLSMALNVVALATDDPIFFATSVVFIILGSVFYIIEKA